MSSTIVAGLLKRKIPRIGGAGETLRSIARPSDASYRRLMVIRSAAAMLIPLVRGAAFLCLPTLVVLSLLPGNDMIRTGAPKVVEHFIAYGGTAGLSALGWMSTRTRRWLIPVGLIVLAGALEYLQRYSPGRDSELDTFIASTIGVVVGAIAGVMLRTVALALSK